MTESERRWRRAPLGADLCTGVVLFVLEALVLLWIGFGEGMGAWAANGNHAEVDAAELAGIAQTEHLAYAVLVIAAIAALCRAPWSVASQLLAAGVLALLVVSAQQGYARAHEPVPVQTPNPYYSPCYSGSGTCH